MAKSYSQGKEYWTVIKITGERSKTYQVEWAGVDPETGRPWPLDWVPKEDVTQDLVYTWKEEKDEREAKKAGELFCSGFCSNLFYFCYFGVV